MIEELCAAHADRVVASAEEAMYPAPAMMFLVPLLLLLLLLLVLRFLFATARRRSLHRHDDDHHRLPPSPPGRMLLPILGHMHLVGTRHPHVTLRDLVRRHGDDDGLLLLRLGQVPNLVVSSPRAAEAVLRAHDRAFASRPPSAVAAVLFSGPSNVSLAPYGHLWRQNRKLVTAHLLSATKVHSFSFRRAREEEAQLLVHRISAAADANVVVDMTDLLGAYVNDVVCRAVSGKRSSRDDVQGRNRTFRELSSGNAAVLGGFNLDDLFPSLVANNKLLLTRMVCAKARRLKKRWDRLLDDIIDEHHAAAAAAAAAKSSSSSSSRPPHDPRRRQEDNNNEEDDDEQEEEEDDFVDVLLSLQHEYDDLTRDRVKAILTDMFAAGTDTSSIVLEYAMVELVRNPHVMTKLRAEITANTPREQDTVKEENLSTMTYLKAVVKETLRLHPPVPLLLPRLSVNECGDVVVINGGYTVPAGTRVIVNAWAIGRDAASWEKADEFMPERFLLKDDDDIHGAQSSSSSSSFIDFKGRDFKFLPFGAGRRMCPGMNFGVATVEIMLANLLYCFHWELPDGMKTEDIDMTELFGLTMRRQQKLRLVPRLLRSVQD